MCEEALEDGQSWNPVVFLRGFAQEARDQELKYFGSGTEI